MLLKDLVDASGNISDDESSDDDSDVELPSYDIFSFEQGSDDRDSDIEEE